MFQWFIRKYIPLTFAKNELPFLAKWMQQNIGKSSELQKEKEKYQVHRSHLNLLQNTKLKQEKFEDYWQELQTKLNKESITSKQPVVQIPKVSYSQFAFAKFALACCLVLSLALFFKFDTNISDYRTSNGGLTFDFLPFGNNKKPQTPKLDGLVPIDLYIKGTNIDLKNQDYQLDQVIQCKLESAKF